MTSNRKLPADGSPFEHFLAQGANRTFLATAKHFGVSPSQVTHRARRERWLERLAGAEHKIAERAQEQIVESLAQMRLRHATVARDLIERGLEALQRFNIVELKDAIRAVEIGVKMEREARELPSKTVSVEVTHELREKLIPANVQPRIEGPKPRVEITFDSLEDGLTEEEVKSVERELEAESDE